ncbi:MAG TPA: DUF488 domain-containing protein [Frankiaceae bacterium]|jgi:uncharacterized protein (DUF488 family)|nr:DUF488 domain-containing protein [Frankiaceae bacterium]
MLLTVGHGTHEQDAFTALLRGAGVTTLVDVRTAPGSRRYPWFGRDALAAWLPEAGIAYEHERALGGFRKPLPGSPNAGWRNESFRGYADYMRTEPFWTALDGVLALAGQVAVMCSESVWWRCHRRLVADAAQVVREVPVEHLMPDGRTSPHRPTEGVRRDGELLVYPG